MNGRERYRQANLTDNQLMALRALQQVGPYPTGNWVIDTRSNTVKILDALVKKGHAFHDKQNGIYFARVGKYGWIEKEGTNGNAHEA